jgi:hypothetical protein
LGHRLAVAQPEHLEHPRIGLWRPQKPVVDVRANAVTNHASELEAALGEDIALQPWRQLTRLPTDHGDGGESEETGCPKGIHDDGSQADP